jgi:hypothetical protein
VLLIQIYPGTYRYRAKGKNFLEEIPPDREVPLFKGSEIVFETIVIDRMHSLMRATIWQEAHEDGVKKRH